MSEAASCVCRKPDDGRFMISCDKCQDWFHGSCVGQFKSKNENIWQWHCPQCCNLWRGKWLKISKTTPSLGQSEQAPDKLSSPSPSKRIKAVSPKKISANGPAGSQPSAKPSVAEGRSIEGGNAGKLPSSSPFVGFNAASPKEFISIAAADMAAGFSRDFFEVETVGAEEVKGQSIPVPDKLSLSSPSKRIKAVSPKKITANAPAGSQPSAKTSLVEGRCIEGEKAGKLPSFSLSKHINGFSPKKLTSIAAVSAPKAGFKRDIFAVQGQSEHVPDKLSSPSPSKRIKAVSPKKITANGPAGSQPSLAKTSLVEGRSIEGGNAGKLPSFSLSKHINGFSPKKLTSIAAVSAPKAGFKRDIFAVQGQSEHVPDKLSSPSPSKRIKAVSPKKITANGPAGSQPSLAKTSLVEGRSIEGGNAGKLPSFSLSKHINGFSPKKLTSIAAVSAPKAGFKRDIFAVQGQSEHVPDKLSSPSPSKRIKAVSPKKITANGPAGSQPSLAKTSLVEGRSIEGGNAGKLQSSSPFVGFNAASPKEFISIAAANTAAGFSRDFFAVETVEAEEVEGQSIPVPDKLSLSSPSKRIKAVSPKKITANAPAGSQPSAKTSLVEGRCIEGEKAGKLPSFSLSKHINGFSPKKLTSIAAVSAPKAGFKRDIFAVQGHSVRGGRLSLKGNLMTGSYADKGKARQTVSICHSDNVAASKKEMTLTASPKGALSASLSGSADRAIHRKRVSNVCSKMAADDSSSSSLDEEIFQTKQKISVKKLPSDNVASPMKEMKPTASKGSLSASLSASLSGSADMAIKQKKSVKRLPSDNVAAPKKEMKPTASSKGSLSASLSGSADMAIKQKKSVKRLPSDNVAAPKKEMTLTASSKGALSASMSGSADTAIQRKRVTISCSKMAADDSSSSSLDEEIFQTKQKKSVKRPPSADNQEAHPPSVCRSEEEEGAKTITKLTCKFCDKSFSCHQNLSRHTRNCRLNVQRKAAHVCHACRKEFNRRYVFNEHVKKCKGVKKVVAYGVGNILCPFENCSSHFQFKVDLYEHLYTKHKADLKPPEVRKFDSFEDFEKWKTKIEDDSYSYFSQQYGKRNGRTYYYCQHDGSNKSHQGNQKAPKTMRRNRKGRIKKGDLCLSMMILTYLSNGKIEVVYRPTHLHPCRPQDLKHQPLSTATNDYITKQLAWSVPPRKIVENLRDNSYKRENRLNKTSIKLKRDNLVKTKTITERMRKKRSSLRYSNNDAESVDMKVKTLMEEQFNPILVYKPLGEETVYGPDGSDILPKDVFLLAFQTKEQLEMMVEGCSEILVVDETHSTNPYGFRLLNLMVKDKFNLGYPVGHAISSRSDDATLQFVFKAIKERCPNITINCCITDDDPALINSVNFGIGKAVWHILCIWHIHRTVQSKLREHIKNNNDLVTEIYGIICVLIDEPNENQFLKLKDSFLQEYAEKCPNFLQYFKDTFLPKAKKWAKCYRQEHHGNTETTMLVESFHNILKTVYLKRVPCKRLDDLMDVMFTIEEDYFTRYTNAVLLQTMSEKDHTALCNRHMKGTKIKDFDVTQVSERHWTVKSQDKNCDDEYHVIKCAEACSSDSCIYVCCYCDTLCSHLFTCSCPDMFPLCKHLHKVFSIVSCQPRPAVKDKAEPEFFTVDNIEGVVEDDEGACMNRQEKSRQQQILKIRDMLKDLDEKYLDTSPVKRMLPRIENTLKDIQTQCRVLFDHPETTALQNLDVKTKTAPSEKLKKQLKPFVKKSKKRKKTGLQRPPRQSVIEIKDFLLQENEENDVDSDLESVSQLNDEQIVDVPVENLLEHEQVVQSTTDVENPLDIVLDYHGLRVSTLHLKALNPTIDKAELPSLLRADPKFVHGWLYDEVINVFLKMLESNNNVFACDTTVALRLCMGNHHFKTLPLKLAAKSVILFPGNLEGNHWVIVAVEVETCSLWFYNSLSERVTLLSQSEKKFLSAVALLLRNVFPLVKAWSVKRHFDVQKDHVSCGIHICWFAYCLATNMAVTPLEDPSQFRRCIYDSIVSLIC